MTFSEWIILLSRFVLAVVLCAVMATLDLVRWCLRIGVKNERRMRAALLAAQRENYEG